MNSNKIIVTIIIILALGAVAYLVFKPKTEVSTPVIVPTDTNPEPSTNPSGSTFPAFGTPIPLSVSGTVAFGDGLNVVLTKIDDSRCPEKVQCIWAGELRATLQVSGGQMPAAKEISIGTVNNKSVTSNGYTFTLNNARVSDINFTVTYKAP